MSDTKRALVEIIDTLRGEDIHSSEIIRMIAECIAEADDAVLTETATVIWQELGRQGVSESINARWIARAALAAGMRQIADGGK